jgi:hypothetical protein
LRRLRFGCGRFGGFARVAEVGADWVHHLRKIGDLLRSFSRSENY